MPGSVPSFWGGVLGGNANKKAEKLLNKQIEENESVYNNNVNRDYLDTNAAKGLLTRIKKQYEEANRTAENRGVVTGASAEETLAEKSQNNEALNNAVSQIADNATQYQENQTNQYMQNKNQLTNEKVQLQQQKAQNAANLVSTAGNALSSVSPLAGLFSKSSTASGTAAAIANRTPSDWSGLYKIQYSA